MKIETTRWQAREGGKKLVRAAATTNNLADCRRVLRSLVTVGATDSAYLYPSTDKSRNARSRVTVTAHARACGPK